MDFSQNLALVAQDECESAHFTQKQVTVHPVLVIRHSPASTMEHPVLLKQSFVQISDNLKTVLCSISQEIHSGIFSIIKLFQHQYAISLHWIWPWKRGVWWHRSYNQTWPHWNGLTWKRSEFSIWCIHRSTELKHILWRLLKKMSRKTLDNTAPNNVCQKSHIYSFVLSPTGTRGAMKFVKLLILLHFT